MVSLIMLAIMVGCAVLLYLKGTLVQGVALVFNALAAGFVAFGFFETLAGFLTKYSPGIAVWAPMIGFAALFVLVFAVLQAVAMQLGKEKSDLGVLPEGIGRVVCGIVLGYLVTGHLLVILALVPHPLFNKYPYERFAERNPNPASPNKPFLSPDGFVTGLFATVSQGSFGALSSPRSFALLRADFLDQLHLNRLKLSQEVPVITSAPAAEVAKNHVWYAPDSLRDAEGKAVSVQAGEDLMLVRLGIKKRMLREAGKFTLSQIRIICAPKGAADEPLAGRGQAVYPIGYIGNDARLERKSLGEIITMTSSDTSSDAQTIDLAFSVPMNLTPVLLEFKLNDAVQLPKPAPDEEAPTMVPFGGAPQAPQTKPEGGQTRSSSPAPPSTPDGERDRRGLSDISKSVTGPLGED
jgi:hypothetical protein